MADQLFLSYRIQDYAESNMLWHFENMLRRFPFSKLSQGGSWLRIQPVSWDEPVVMEQAFADDADVGDLLKAAGEFALNDAAVEIQSHWDLWQYGDDDWKLAPSRVSLYAFGPEFEGEIEDHLRIDLGLDGLYLPQDLTDNEEPMVQANIRSVLQLAADLDKTLAVESRRLWTESGENFALRLQQLLMQGSGLRPV